VNNTAQNTTTMARRLPTGHRRPQLAALLGGGHQVVDAQLNRAQDRRFAVYLIGR
jgi:hypothetical protein